jgi:hypothetical protein
MRPFNLLSFVLFSAGALSAQTGPATSSTSSRSGVFEELIGPAPASIVSNTAWFAASVVPGMPGGAVAGAPYSAEQVTEHVQTLADGTHITQPVQTRKLYRDSQGRTRTERSAPLPPGLLGTETAVPVFIEISDPAAGVRYSLETQRHTAHRIPMPVAPPPPPPPASASGAPAARMIRPRPAQLPAQAGPVSQAPSSRPESSHESLGTQIIEGVLAEGSRTTVTYPIGLIGNDRPITTTTETWTSPELKMVVLSKTSDPRTGESTTRLTNISRAEPDPSLFQVPPDYEIIIEPH